MKISLSVDVSPEYSWVFSAASETVNQWKLPLNLEDSHLEIVITGNPELAVWHKDQKRHTVVVCLAKPTKKLRSENGPIFFAKSTHESLKVSLVEGLYKWLGSSSVVV